jgi:hypothetical protein
LHCVNEACKPILKDHPWRVAAYNTLLGCYVSIDPIGHAHAIRQCLRQLSKEIPRGPGEHRYVMMNHQRKFLMALGQFKQAEKVVLRHLALFDEDVGEDEWYIKGAVVDMCWIGYRQQDWEKVCAYAEQGEELVRHMQNSQHELAEAQLWQAVCARKEGNETRAKRLLRGAVNRIRHLEAEPFAEYYDALAYFHELGENLDKALEVREQQLARTQGTGRLGYECEIHLQRCELLARLGRLTGEDLDRAHEATRPLKEPKPYLARLKRLKKDSS